MKLSILAIVSAVVSAVSALTPPVGDPSGNPIARPGLNEQVPVSKPFTISWAPTTPGTVSIRLLRGPTENVVPIATIVEGIANSGSYVWTPSSSLEADVARYGIQIIVDGTGQYQYSTQFGISNEGGAVVVPTTTAAPTTTAKPSTTAEPTTISTTAKPTTLSTKITSNAITTLSTTKGPATTKSPTTTTEAEEEETETPNTPTTTSTPVSTQSPTQDSSSAAGKTIGSFGLVAFIAGVAALSFF